MPSVSIGGYLFTLMFGCKNVEVNPSSGFLAIWLRAGVMAIIPALAQSPCD